MHKVWGIAVLFVIGVVIIFFLPREVKGPEINQSTRVSNFESCVAAGYPVMESFPAQCRTADGRIFVQEVEPTQADVVVSEPQPNALVKSPLTVKGKARGTWFFEASLPVGLTDQNGKILVRKPFHSIGDWMTTDYVEFEGTLTFNTPTTSTGYVTVQRDNPSGLPQFDESIQIPVRFK